MQKRLNQQAKKYFPLSLLLFDKLSDLYQRISSGKNIFVKNQLY